MLRGAPPPPVTLLGFNLPGCPAGTPPPLRPTLRAPPLGTPRLLVAAPASPAVRLRLAGLALIEKSLDGGGGAPNVYVWTSKVAPFSSVGVTVTEEPDTITSR